MKKLLLSILVACPLFVQAQGFQVSLQGQKQIAMGHTGTGLKMDAASIFFNPGAVSMLETNSISAGISPIFAKTSYVAPERGWYTSNPDEYYKAETSSSPSTPFTVYGVWGPKEGALNRFKFGLGVYTPFGSNVKWGDNWGGRFALQQISLQSIFIQPTVSFKITESLGIGAGLVYTVGSVNLQRAFTIADANGNYGKTELDGKANGLGFNAGIFYQPIDQFSVGISYRSKVNMKVDGGDAKFTGLPTSIVARFQDVKFDSELPLPQVASIGFGFYPSEKLTLSLDVNYVGWSDYDTLAFDFDKADVPDSKAGRKYEDIFIFRLGGQYKANDQLSLRAGGYYGISPVQNGYLTPETPDANRFGLSAGLGYRLGEHFEVDGSFVFVNTKKRTDINRETGFGGTFKTFAFIPGVSVSYNF
jgi:long-chain fatty acid transport protein